LMVLAESYSDPASPGVTGEDRNAAIENLDEKNKLVAARADQYARKKAEEETGKTEETGGEEFKNSKAKYKREYYWNEKTQKGALKAIDIYEDSNGNNRWVIGVGQKLVFAAPAVTAPLGQPLATMFNYSIEAGMPLGGGSLPEAAEAQLVDRAVSEIIARGGLVNLAEINVYARTDPRGSEEVNAPLLEKRKESMQRIGKKILEKLGLSADDVQVTVEGAMATGPVIGNELDKFASDRKGRASFRSNNKQEGANIIEVTIGAYAQPWVMSYTFKEGETVSDLAARLKEENYAGSDAPLDLVTQISRFFAATQQTPDVNKVRAGVEYQIPVEDNSKIKLEVKDNSATSSPGVNGQPQKQRATSLQRPTFRSAADFLTGVHESQSTTPPIAR
jgi:hypothetical protein